MSEWRAFLSAVQFLTRLPVPDCGWEDGRLDRAAKWFPMVGLIVGALCALILWLAIQIWAGEIPILLALLTGVLVTGALHEDGLADTADGLGGGRDRAHRLEIMKDSRIGAYGALALIFIALTKFGALSSFAGQKPSLAIAAFIAAHVLSRATMTALIWSLPYAREPEETRIAPLLGTAGARDWGVAMATALLALMPLSMLYGLDTGLAVVTGGVLACVLAFLAMRLLLRRALGGWTGDGAGATQQVCETGVMLAMAAAWS